MKSPGLFRLIREDLRAHRGGLMRPGFQTLAIYRFGRWRLKLRPRFLRVPFSILYHTANIFCRNFYGIELPESAIVGRRVVFEHQHGITIHGAAVIGDDCVIRQGVTVGNRRLEDPFDAPILGNRVNIGTGAKVLGRIHVGDDVHIGANSVVLEDVAAGDTVVGIPARPVGRRPRREDPDREPFDLVSETN